VKVDFVDACLFGWLRRVVAAPPMLGIDLMGAAAKSGGDVDQSR
jgi:hypothetical protein